MDRRNFIKTGALGASLPFWLQSCQLPFDNRSYTIDVHSDHAVGHLILESQNWNKTAKTSVETVIVGGGMAGLAAAYQLRGKEFQLFELSSRIGGSAASTHYKDLAICQGAHYDLDYPEYYGQEVLSMLESLDVIVYEKWNKSWSFRDKQHLIPLARRQQCFENGNIRGDVIPEGSQKKEFLDLLSSFLGEMPLPTRLIKEEHRWLNGLTFHDFLNSRMAVDDRFKRLLDYHMLDDYGGKTDQVSALSGIHYFMCRPYYSQLVNLFSPPSGNDYFAKRIIDRMDDDKIKTGHLVSRIDKVGDSFVLDVLDVQNKTVKQVSADRVIYAGQKHALKYISPDDFEDFKSVEQAPWMVINFVTNQKKNSYGYWQNEYLGQEHAFLGFIDSSVQDQASLKGYRILTAYYCLKPDDREYLSTIPTNKDEIVKQTLQKIEAILNQRLDIEHTLIHVMGHAMPIPKPGYLFQEKISKSGIKYAGVDCGRLPLLFEALDSGILSTRL